MNRCWIISCLIIISFCSAAFAQDGQAPSVLAGRPDAAPADLLGEVFESLTAGIAFRAPAGAREVRRTISGDEIVHYVDEQRKWQLKVSRIQFGEPLPLETKKDAKGRDKLGLLDLTIKEIKVDQPSAEILRDEIVPVGDTTAGMIAARYSLGRDTTLLQQAILRASDRYYFVFSFTSPAPRQGEIAEDPAVQNAVQTFNAVLDSARLIDQSAIKEDQNQRLFRTRALMVNLSETRLRNALAEEQWLRLIRDGNDIGYIYIVQEVASDLPRKGATARGGAADAASGIRIGMRSRTSPEAGLRVDGESWMWMSFDKRHEQWSSVAWIAQGDEREQISEFGASDFRIARALDPRLRGGDVRADGTVDKSQPPVRTEESYVLTVTHFSKSATAQPVERQLPVFYVPQALGYLLPQLLPRFEPKGYMFASYVSDKREVMSRYMDVERETEVTLDGKRVRAIPVTDRIGLEGPVTTHYLSSDGKYLGSTNLESGITILPTDRQTLEKMWKDADLSRPGDVLEK